MALDIGRDLNRAELRRRRLLAGHTQESLAKTLDTSSTYICDIEKGRSTPSPRLLKRLADALGCRTEDLVRENDEAVPA